jgi:hypothetical protein
MHLNNPLAIGLLCQLLSTIPIAVALTSRKYRVQRMATIIGCSLFVFGALLVDMVVFNG